MTHPETERIRCPSCGALVTCPVGPRHWYPAYGHWARPVSPLTCQACETAIGVVQLAWLVTVPMRMKQLAGRGVILCARKGQLPTHEDMDQVEQFMGFLAARKAERQEA